MLEISTNLYSANNKIVIFHKLLERVYECPLRALGKKVPRIAYMKKIESFIWEGYDIDESILMVKKILREDYEKGFIKYHQFYQIGRHLDKLLEEYRKMVQEGLVIDHNEMKKLLLDYLMFLSNLNRIPSRFSVSELANALNCDRQTIKNFTNWLRNSEYSKLVELIIGAKKLRKTSTQHSVVK